VEGFYERGNEFLGGLIINGEFLIFIYLLFNDAVSSSDYIAANGRMNSEVAT
jgi:hypothetical protein